MANILGSNLEIEKGKAMEKKYRFGGLIGMLLLVIMATTTAAVTPDSYGVFSYGGVAEADGRKAQLTFRITPDRQIVDGKLTAQSVCGANIRLPSTNIDFQGAIALAMWEGDGALINGAWTGGDYGCDGNKMTDWPENGNITISFKQNGYGEYSVKAVRIGPYGYFFKASGKTYDPSIDLERQGDQQKGIDELDEALKLYKDALTRTSDENRKNTLKAKIEALEKEIAKNPKKPAGALKGYWYGKDDTAKNVYLIFEHIEADRYKSMIGGVITVTGEARFDGKNLGVNFKRDNESLQLDFVLTDARELQGTWKNSSGDSGSLTLVASDQVIITKGLGAEQSPEAPWQWMQNPAETNEGEFKKVL